MHFGPGLLESLYTECLAYRLIKHNLFVEMEKPIPVIYEEVKMSCGFRCDLVIERKLILEIKSIDAIADIHLAQLLTYLKLMDLKLGLLLNFNVIKMKDGIKRVVNGL